MNTVIFTIPGRVGGKQRAGRQHLPGGKVRSFNPAKTSNQEAMVRQIAALAMREQGTQLMLGAVALDIMIWKTPPRSWSNRRQREAKWVTSKPDWDNIGKLIADALNGIVWRDDAQIADAHVSKRYSAGVSEQVRITIQELDY